MLNCRMFKDGDSVVIYFDKCNPNLEEILKGLLQPIIESESRLEELEKEDEDVVIPGNYPDMSGKTVKQYLTDAGDEGFANIRYLVNKGKFGDQKETVQRILSQWIFDKFYSVDAMEYASNLEDVDHFLQCFDSLITEDMKNTVKNITQFIDYPSFVKGGSKEQKLSLVISIIENIQGR